MVAAAPAAGAGGRSLSCPSCTGVLYGLSPFERMLDPGLGARVWVAAADGPPGEACPYCRRPMRAPEPAADLPTGIRVCRLCEEVWVPGPERGWISAHSPGGAGGVGGLSGGVGGGGGDRAGRCPTCGAPLEPDPAGRCRYCRTQVAAPAPVVIAGYDAGPTGPRSGAGGLAGLAGLAGLLDRLVD